MSHQIKQSVPDQAHERPSTNTARRPEVIVEFVFDKGLLFIAIRNIGERPALNVSVKFNEKIEGLGGAKDISRLAVFRDLKFLGPQREIQTLVDSSSSYFSRKQPLQVSAEIKYCDPEQNEFHETVHHNLEIYRELVYLNQTTNRRDVDCGD